MTSDISALEACSREPIHIPGSIQPHGYLVVFDAEGQRCRQLSANWPTLVPGESVESWLGKAPEEILPEALVRRIRDAATGADPAADSLTTVRIGDAWYDAAVHRHDGLLLVEIEPGNGPVDPPLHRRLQDALTAMRAAPDLAALHGLIARFIADMSGYGRVMVYQFDQDWHGQVVGEALLSADEFGSYLGHHFPASDIPEQARALYTKSWLRIIPEVNYTPAAVVPTLNPVTGRPLDLSFTALRSVSPVHLEYLRNMGVGASMSVSLIVDGRLWGLIACHHPEARFLPFSTRAACALFGQVASLEIAAREESARLGQFAEATRIQTRFFDVIAREQNFADALMKYTPELLAFMAAGGAAVHLNGRTTLLGETPSEADVDGIFDWLRGKELTPLLATDSLSRIYPPATAFASAGSGLLAVRLSPVEFQCLLFFRPEVVTSLTWAGNPAKPQDPASALHPRESFAAWVETVRGHSLPWSEVHRQGALELRAALNASVLRRTERLISSNEALEKRNTDLQSFAHIAAHDLKEPLRGIAQYSQYIQEDHGETLEPEALRRLRTIHDLAVHSSRLLEALSRFSKLGRMEIDRRTVDLDEILTGVLSGLGSLLSAKKVDLRRPRPLPWVSCDPVLIREVFSNLIVNAAKYNLNPKPWIEIGWRDNPHAGGPPVFHVSDNGIGIEERHWEVIFTMFRRLHPKDAYGGGTGAGLAIVQSIVSRHQGSVRVVSTPGAGSTFFFSLG